jgi:hypothetical protein
MCITREQPGSHRGHLVNHQKGISPQLAQTEYVDSTVRAQVTQRNEKLEQLTKVRGSVGEKGEKGKTGWCDVYTQP